MTVRIQLTPPLWKYVRSYNQDTGIVLENAEGWTVLQIIEELKIPPGEVFVIMVNSYPGKPTSVVKDGDFVILAKILGGG
jgi:sulfur carrier protein ThiS